MQIRQKTMLLTILSLLSLLAGCSATQKPAEVVVFQDSIEQQSDSVAKRFQESAPQAPTAVESAIELSEKYAKLSEEAAGLRQKNKDIVAENRQLKDKVTTLNAQLQQTQKELTEANDLLIEMRIELNNWKTDILGFRGEMRDAEKAQIEALIKILKVLGGEIRAESSQGNDTSATAISSSEPGKSEPKENPQL